MSKQDLSGIIITVDGDFNDSNLVISSDSSSIVEDDPSGQGISNVVINRIETTLNNLTLHVDNSFALETNFQLLITKFNNLINVLKLGDLSGVLDSSLNELSYN